MTSTMASYIPLLTAALTILLIQPTFSTSTVTTRASSQICYKSIISFGDSLADTGNLLLLINLDLSEVPLSFFLPPYGETYFHHPTGRCSDGRLIVDFIAERLGLPFVPPYLAGKSDATGREFVQGVNFAVAGATALDATFLQEKGIYNPFTNASLGIQLGWFKLWLDSVCKTSSGCKEYLQSSLVLMGEIGGNDYNYALFRRKFDDATSFVTPVISALGSAITEMIELGAKTLVVPGNLPIGCVPIYLTYFQSSNEHEYDKATGCIKWLNEFSEYYNKLLRMELSRLREVHSHATIIYADYYNAAMRIYRDPLKYGFENGALSACCGGGGPYNFNDSAPCTSPSSRTCDDPSSYVSWDGVHWTEAAYRLIAQGILDGPYSDPPITTICGLASTSTAQY